MPMYKKSMLILLLLLTAAAVGSLYGYSISDEAVNIEAKGAEVTGKEENKISKNEIIVYVCGEVNQPGLVTIEEGMRVADAVNKCGGVLPTADTNSINMAQVLKDGMEVKIPAKLVTSQNTNGNINKISEAGGAVVQGNSLVNINQADNKTLETLPGIGPAMAQRIIDFRKENGSFQSVDDLQKVKGIGKAKFAKIKDKVTV